MSPVTPIVQLCRCRQERAERALCRERERYRQAVLTLQSQEAALASHREAMDAYIAAMYNRLHGAVVARRALDEAREDAVSLRQQEARLEERCREAEQYRCDVELAVRQAREAHARCMVRAEKFDAVERQFAELDVMAAQHADERETEDIRRRGA